MNYVLLFLPFALSYLAIDTPVIAYWIAWSGSIIILWSTISGRVKALPDGTSFKHQLFRPLVFTQVVFAGYTGLTSVFYFLELSNRASEGVHSAQALLPLAATAQSFYVLGHAAMVTGILLFMNYADSGKFQLVSRLGASRILFGLSAIFLVLSVLAFLFPSLLQITIRLRSIAMVASVFSFALSLVNREGTHVTLNAIIFSINFLLALAGGWKEEVLVLMILFLAAIFPFYKRLSIILGISVAIVFATVMPAYNKLYRDFAWYGNVAPQQAMKLALNEVRSGRIDLRESTATFATERLSEIGLFVKYLQRVPTRRPFYGTQILEQTALSMVPRLIWPDKPNIEHVVMERVYENTGLSRKSPISAKPQYLVDCYLWWGIPGIVIGCLIFGALASIMSRLCERWFSGYTLGSGLVYAALFQIFWRGNSFEFFFPTILWSFITMLFLFQIGRRLHIFALTPEMPVTFAARGPNWREVARASTAGRARVNH
jgi:hypothetical protein